MARKDERKAAAEELRSVAKHLISMAEKLEGKEEKETPREELSYTDARQALAEKSRAGHTAKIKEILISHGADKLSAIDPKEYAGILKDAEVLV